MSELAICESCEKTMRPLKALLADYPGTVSRATSRFCSTCYAKGRRHVEAPPPSDEPCVPTRPLLRPSTYVVFRRKAAELGTTVDQLLSRMADAAAAPRPT